MVFSKHKTAKDVFAYNINKFVETKNKAPNLFIIEVGFVAVTSAYYQYKSKNNKPVNITYINLTLNVLGFLI